jgi:hypothetical protein
MAFTAVSAAIGLGTAIYGASQQAKNVKKANKAAESANKQQKLVQEQTQIASEASIRAEQLRERQMELEGLRRRRDILRSAQAARSLGLAAAIAQGVDPGSSSVQAGQQSARSRQTVDLLANIQNIEIGRGVFEENRKITQAQAKGAQYQTNANIFQSQQQSYLNKAGTGQQLVGFGLNLVSAAPTIGRVATTSLFSNPNPQPTWMHNPVNWTPLK